MVSEPDIQDTPEQLQILQPTVQTLYTLRLITPPTDLTATSKRIQNKTKMLVSTLPLINWSSIPIYYYPIADEKQRRIYRNKNIRKNVEIQELKVLDTAIVCARGILISGIMVSSFTIEHTFLY